MNLAFLSSNYIIKPQGLSIGGKYCAYNPLDTTGSLDHRLGLAAAIVVAAHQGEMDSD
ncbi:MAG TPA: hypothetical protein VII97_10355 [Anaerolineales bacterium]